MAATFKFGGKSSGDTKVPGHLTEFAPELCMVSPTLVKTSTIQDKVRRRPAFKFASMVGSASLRLRDAWRARVRSTTFAIPGCGGRPRASRAL